MPKSRMRDWLAPSELLWPDANEGPWTLRLEWGLKDGSVVCQGIALKVMEPHEAEVTATLLRSLRVGELIAEARQQRYLGEGGGWVDVLSGTAEEGKLPADLVQAAVPWAEKSTGRPRSLDLSHYRKVAAVYEKARANKQRPRIAVMTELGAESAPTASRWIAEARRIGLLGPPAIRPSGAAAPRQHGGLDEQ